MKTRTPYLFWIIGLALGFTGCGSFQVPVTHSPLPPAPNTTKGIILVTSFSDTRAVPDQRHLGEARNTAGLHCAPIVDSQYRTVTDIMTSQFAEALRAAGYQTILPNTDPAHPQLPLRANAVLEGKIRECWLTTSVGVVSYNRVKITIQVQLRQPQTGELLYEKSIARDDEYRSSWKRALRKALDAVLIDVMQDFSSDAFSQALALEVQQTAAR